MEDDESINNLPCGDGDRIPFITIVADDGDNGDGDVEGGNGNGKDDDDDDDGEWRAGSGLNTGDPMMSLSGVEQLLLLLLLLEAAVLLLVVAAAVAAGGSRGDMRPPAGPMM